jgi:UDP-4-amino-4-deoxy-L-arabinose-oxoglutarate aminotransferase
VARDGERRSSTRRDARLRRRPRRDLNIDPEHVRELVTPRTKAILPVHLAGQPADLDPLLELGLPVVEDAAHAVESVYRGRKVGAISDVTCFSLYATKNVAAGEGGIVATDRDDVASAIDELRIMRRGHGSLYDIAVPGYKANLSDVLAAIALVQLDKLDRHARSASATSSSTTPRSPSWTGSSRSPRDPRDVHALHLYVVRVDPSAPARTRDEYQRALATRTSARRIHFLPVHQLTAYRELSRAAAAAGRRARRREVLSLPLSPAHSDDDIADAIAALRRVHERFAG